MTEQNQGNQGNTYLNMEQAMQEIAVGNFRIAEELLLASYGALETELLHNCEMRSKIFHLLANCYRNRSEFQLAREFYEKAQNAVSANKFSAPPFALFEDSYVEALCEADYALALATQQDLQRCLAKFTYSPGSCQLKNLLRLSALYWLQSRYFESEKCLEEFLRLGKVKGEIPKHDYVAYLCSLAVLNLRLERFAQAESYYKTALQIGTEFDVIPREDLSEMLSQLGLALCSQGKVAEAQKTCARAATCREDLMNAETTAGHFRAIADYYCEKSCLDEASKYCNAALDLFEIGGGQKTADPQRESAIQLFRRLGLVEDAQILTAGFYAVSA